MTTEETILFYIGFRAYIGKAMNRHWRDFKFNYRARRNFPKKCDRCGKPINVKTYNANRLDNMLTVEHIIPKSMLYELELIELFFDDDNFALYCLACNTSKSNKLPKITELPPQLLAKFYTSIDNRNELV